MLEKELIEEVKTKFRNGDFRPSIYFDLDNTLMLFSTYGHVEESLNKMYTEGFYRNLPVFAEAPFVLESLVNMEFNVGVITHYINTPTCRAEKLQSLHYYFPMITDDRIYLVPSGSNKAEVVPDASTSILVDDYKGNIEQWYKAGGVGVKKSYSGKKRDVPVVTSLIGIFNILYDLDCLRRDRLQI